MGMNHIDRKQNKKSGHFGLSEESLDVIYNNDDSMVRPRAHNPVDLKKMPGRKSIAIELQGADEMYDWTNFVDKKQVPAPNIELLPDRETRMKQGYGSSADGAADLMYDHKRMAKHIATRPPGV